MTSSHSINRRNILKTLGLGIGALSMPRLVVANASDGFIELRATKTQHKLAGEKYPTSDLWLLGGYISVRNFFYNWKKF